MASDMPELTVSVININHKATIAHLLPLFRPHGATGATLPLDAPGIAMVTCSTSTQAQWAATLTDNMRHMGRTLRVKSSKPEDRIRSSIVKVDENILRRAENRAPEAGLNCKCPYGCVSLHNRLLTLQS